MTSPSVALAGAGLGDSLLRTMLASLVQRLGFALGLVLGVALLGGLAFAARQDVRVLWFDERGHLAIGMNRTKTQERLEETQRELAELKRQLERAKSSDARSTQLETGDLRRYEERTQAAEQRAWDAAGALQRAQGTLTEQERALGVLKRQTTELEAKLRDRETSQEKLRELAAETVTKDREILRLKELVKGNAGAHEYRAWLASDHGYLPLRERPERAGRTLKAIPHGAPGVVSNCRLAVAEDAVFIEASYQGVRGWVSAFYLSHGPQ